MIKTSDDFFKFMNKTMMNSHKPDLHSFTAKTEKGDVFVEAREDQTFLVSGDKINYCGNTIQTTNYLTKIGIDYLSIDM